MNKELKPTRVLYFEDDEPTIDLVRISLRRENMELIGQTDSRDAVNSVIKYAPALVLLDLMMPGVDGWEVFQSMKANEFCKTIPVIVITAKAQSMDKVLGLHIAKVADYITKPFSPSELINSIRRVLATVSA